MEKDFLGELNSDHIDRVMAVLRMFHGDQLAGLEATGYGQYVSGRSMPRFEAAGRKRFAQIFNTGDHWICATNIFSKNTHDIYVYDSLYATVPETLLVQLSSIMRAEEDPDELNIHVRNFQQQDKMNRMCGFYAVASLVSVVLNVDPTRVLYDENSMPQHFFKLYEKGEIKQFTYSINNNEKQNISVKKYRKLHCLCQKKSSGRMIQCVQCVSWFHMDTCVTVEASQNTLNEMVWLCPCCDIPRPQENEIIDVSDEGAL